MYIPFKTFKNRYNINKKENLINWCKKYFICKLNKQFANNYNNFAWISNKKFNINDKFEIHANNKNKQYKEYGGG